MRLIYIFISLIMLISMYPVQAKETNDDVALIIEVEGNVNQYEQLIEKEYPSIKIVQTYSILFQGIALKGSSEKLSELLRMPFIRTIYPVQTYKLAASKYNIDKSLNKFKKINETMVVPDEENDTKYTGKGINVAVIDTGIDYNHPDLKKNYVKGKDLVDLDNDPMETKEEEGPPTNHGTHVAGIIGANGSLKGVAPDVNLYAYRALGPGGIGTTVQILAALEEAVKDDVDIINLSLGNAINGPDYPTSKAVNEAAKRGIAVIIASGNEGPDDWTVGSPATAKDALTVGAYQQALTRPQLYDYKQDHTVDLVELPFFNPWNLTRDKQITTKLDSSTSRGKLVLLELNENSYEQLIEAEKFGIKGALIYESDTMMIESLVQTVEKKLSIPVALVEKEDAMWLKKRIKKEPTYFKQKKFKQDESIASFSSRGPVTLNWAIKPDLIAPGVNVLSTVPGGYDMFNGTSMASPHVAGMVALIKEAQPKWTNEQIFGALKTTAKKIKAENSITQGTGRVQVKHAIETETIIYNPLLAFGKVNDHITERTVYVKIENTSKTKQRFTFKQPKKEMGLSWHLPKTFTLQPKEIKELPITLKTNSKLLEKGIYEDELILITNNATEYTLPYMFINETADYPHVMGFTFQLKLTDEKKYYYELYVAEQAKSIHVQLYDPETLISEGELLHLTDPDVGLNKGEIANKKIKKKGHFYGLIIVQLNDGTYVNYETDVLIQ